MTRVSFQGERWAYSEQAVYKFFGKDAEVVPCETFTDLFTRVSDGAADFGVAPVENSTAGTIVQVYDLLLEHDLHVVGEIYENATRFFVVSPEALTVFETNKTSLVFATRNEPGALYECLGEFAKRGINLTKIESRPRPNRPWEYVFYLDFEEDHNNGIYAQAVAGLLKRAAFVKILGSYRAAE